jgi:hypothetical protein
MADWKTELDALVRETMAVTKTLEAGPPAQRTIAEQNRIPPLNGIKSEREEIRERVASFKAHQQRFIRERENYASSQWERVAEGRPSLPR